MPWEQTAGGYKTKDRGGFVKNPGQYEKLRSKGMSKQRAARITNAVSKEHRMKDSIELEKSDNLWRRDVVAKAGWKDRSKGNRNTALGTAIGGAGLGTGIGAATAAKKGKGLRTGALAGGRSLAEGVGGATAGTTIGGGLGALASRGRGGGAHLGGQLGGTVGGTAGAYHGGNASINNSRKKGFLKRNY